MQDLFWAQTKMSPFHQLAIHLLSLSFWVFLTHTHTGPIAGPIWYIYAKLIIFLCLKHIRLLSGMSSDICIWRSPIQDTLWAELPQLARHQLKRPPHRPLRNFLGESLGHKMSLHSRPFSAPATKKSILFFLEKVSGCTKTKFRCSRKNIGLKRKS